MSEPYVGEIRCFPYTYAPRDWAYCDGQLLPIAQNSMLFAVIGTLYGGNGQTNFAVPNLMGRAAVHSGQGPGLTTQIIGTSFGQNFVQVFANEMPVHDHTVYSELDRAELEGPAGAVPGIAQKDNTGYYAYNPQDKAGTLTTADPAWMAMAGNSQGHENRQPLLTLGYFMALDGIFPSRS